MIYHWLLLRWPSVAGPGAGVLGILIAIVAHRAFRDLAVVRYDALSEMSGQLSFSVALLNALGDGVVLSSINERPETRTYAKIVRSCAGMQALSPEEERAVRAARLGQGLPAAEWPATPR